MSEVGSKAGPDLLVRVCRDDVEIVSSPFLAVTSSRSTSEHETSLFVIVTCH
jgi:hypothetical protein